MKAWLKGGLIVFVIGVILIISKLFIGVFLFNDFYGIKGIKALIIILWRDIGWSLFLMGLILCAYGIIKEIESMKAWLKGGLIGGGIYFIISLLKILNGFIGSNGLYQLWVVISTPHIVLVNFVLASLFKLRLSIANPEIIYLILIGIIFYFLLGALIGFIIQKIKEKKNESVA